MDPNKYLASTRPLVMGVPQQAAAKVLLNLERSMGSMTETMMASAIRRDPSAIFRLAGMVPDRWQAEILRSTATRILMCCSRQSGKSLAVGMLAIKTAVSKPGSKTLLLSPSLRQSSELFRDKVMPVWRRLGSPIKAVRQGALGMELANGSRIICLPACENTIVGFSSVDLLVIDEGAYVKDNLYKAVRPFLAVSNGQLVCLSTPFGKRGWFWESWFGIKQKRTGDCPTRDCLRIKDQWSRWFAVAKDCPRITKRFLADERADLGERAYGQWYECQFADSMGSVFSYQDIQAALSGDVAPLNCFG